MVNNLSNFLSELDARSKIIELKFTNLKLEEHFVPEFSNDSKFNNFLGDDEIVIVNNKVKVFWEQVKIHYELNFSSLKSESKEANYKSLNSNRRNLFMRDEGHVKMGILLAL